MKPITPSRSAKTSVATAKRVLRIEADAISGLIDRLDEGFEKAVELAYACKGRVVVTGLGKSGLIGRKIAAHFPRQFLQQRVQILLYELERQSRSFPRRRE